METLHDFLRQSFEMLMPPGYTSMSSMKNFISMILRPPQMSGIFKGKALG